MFWELIATIFAGFAGAGVVLLINKLSGGRLPKAAMPVFAGLTMIVFSVVSEMTWYPRSVGQLPDTVQVIRTNESRAFYRPWTYVTPFINRFAAVDVGGAQSNPEVPHQRIVDVYLLERWQASHALQLGVDCAENQQTLMDIASFDGSGVIVSPAWENLEGDDPLIKAVCQTG